MSTVNHMTNAQLIEVLKTLPPEELVSVSIQINHDAYSYASIVQGAESIGGRTSLLFHDSSTQHTDHIIHVETY